MKSRYRYLRTRWLPITAEWLLMVLLITLPGCTKRVYRQASSVSIGNQYDTGFPDKDCSDQLETILKSVKKVNCFVNYRTYVFGEQSHIILSDLKNEQLISKIQASLLTNEATSGTALVVLSDKSKLALLTCAHVVDLPDTVINWSEYSDLGSNRYIHSISVKIRQLIAVRDMGENNSFTLLASDHSSDLALLGRISSEPAAPAPVFPFPAGDSKDLGWGSFIYLAGYPAGQLMVTKGIVSKAADARSNFLTDAPFNEGFSGGIALATREGVPNFELVGIGRSVSARTEYYLKPEKENYEYSYNPAIPYQGSLYVSQKKDLNYGITWVIPINQVREFYLSNRLKLHATGFDLDSFFGITK